jgi:ABC-type polysaccharide/polyol phosphate export permease
MLVPIFFMAASVGLFSSILSTLTTDVTRISTFVLSLLMFITPVIYNSDDKAAWLQQLNLYNPLTYLITGPRDLILYGEMDHVNYFLYAIVLSVVMFFISLRFFYVAEKKIVEKMI